MPGVQTTEHDRLSVVFVVRQRWRPDIDVMISLSSPHTYIMTT
jgi:hypothetical protein